MGTKRVGLARTQALLENLARSLDLNGSTLTDVIINTSQSVTVSGGTKLQGSFAASNYMRQPATSNGAPTAISAGELAVNTFFTNAETAAKAYTLPKCADGAIGDHITVLYIDAIGNGVAHTYTLHSGDDNYTLGSSIVRVGGAAASFSDVSTTNDDIITITGATNGDGGKGTIVRFVNMTGAKDGWAAEVVVLNQGNGSSTSSSTAFSAG